MPVIIYDPLWEQRIRDELNDPQVTRREEVWEGVLVVPPLANNEHQLLLTDLALAFATVVNRSKGDRVLAGCNVSDRDADWTTNYREPDVAVYLATNPAKDSGTHWVGGPDLAVEITSPGEDPRLKLDFYGQVKTRELLIVDRDPWQIELYQLRAGKLVSAGIADATNGLVLTSIALPLTFQFQSGTPRPTILMKHTSGSGTWTA